MTSTTSSPRPPGRLERALAWVSYRALLRVATLARRRGDDHEVIHCAAALAVGNTGPHHDPCMLNEPATRAVLELADRMRLAKGPVGGAGQAAGPVEASR